MRGVIIYFLRALASVPVSFAVSCALNYITMVTLHAVLTLVPAIIGGIFYFDTQECIQDIYYNQLIPGLGSISSIINSPDFSARVMAFFFVILLFVALVILGYAVYLLSKLTKDNVMAIVVSCVVFFINFIYVSFLILSGETYEQIGIETGFWYYFASIIILLILLVIYGVAGMYLWGERNNYRGSQQY